MALISITALTKVYRMGDVDVRALDGVDLEISAGEFVAITGASGSGKSTLMHVLGCLDRPTSGAYVLDGRKVSALSDRELAQTRNRKIGFVFQTFNLINRTTALDNVSVPLFYAHRTNARGPARRALERVGLARRAHHRPNELSGGERQRVAIARAIVNDPVLVLADEPTGNLDSRTGEQIMEIFHSLNRQGVTIILVTHEPEVALQARRIVQMRDGRIVSDRPNEPAARTATEPAATPTRGPDASAPGGPGAADPPPSASSPRGGAKRQARGATAALACGVLAPLLVAGALAVGYQFRGTSLGAGETPSTTALVTLGGALAAIVTALVLGVVAIVRSRRVLRSIRSEPGVWQGAGQARLALVLGWLVVLTPVLAIVVRVVT